MAATQKEVDFFQLFVNGFEFFLNRRNWKFWFFVCSYQRGIYKKKFMPNIKKIGPLELEILWETFRKK